MQEYLLNKVKTYFIKNRRCFLYCLFIGFMAHGYAMFNKLSIHDDMMLNGVGSTFASGRWFLGMLGIMNEKFFGGNNSIPLFNGVVSIMLMAIACSAIVSLLKLTDYIEIGIVCWG